MKITINNEEVLCDKNFTIEEEMLNTSSVILNNVYPATWEEDKDYTSRFYYPKDYSKCKIFNEIEHPATREDVEGTSFSINVDTTKQYQVQTLKGQTSQSGTPTPSSPQPINVVSGRQEVSVVGNNVYNKKNFDWIRNNDQNYKNQTNTNTTRIRTQTLLKLEGGTTYTISGIPSGITLNAIKFYSNPSDTIQTSLVQTTTFTVPSNATYIIIQLAGTGFDDSTNILMKNADIMINKGTTALPYEAYKGQSYEINLGKNLFDINGTIQVGTLDRYNYGFTLIRGTNRVLNIKLPQMLDAGTYTLSFDMVNSNLSAVNKFGVQAILNGTGVSNNSDNNNHILTFTTTSQFNALYFYILSDQSNDATITIDNIQLEKGSTKTSFSPYKTPIYLGEIGTYQDYIFRNTTENPLYDSNLEEGQWYIHKEVGKVSSYNGETITTDYISTTGQKTTGATIYYGISATNTLIEDEELINQLNSIELLEGLNNVSVSSPYLPFIMSLMYNYQEGYTEEDMLFCGVVENTGNISLNPRYPHYCNLQVLDFKTFLSEGETLDFVIYNKTILEAINQVVSTISEYGFVLGNVNILHSDDVIGAYSTKDKTAYDVFNYLADITQSRWTTRMIDENTVAIDFYDPTLMPEGVAIDYTKEWFCNNNIMDMSFSYSSRDYRNKQVMLSGEVYANIETTEVIVADGYQTQFNTTDKIGSVSSILLNGNPATIITKEEYDLGYTGNFIYQPGNKYFESTNLVSTGAIITIVYFAIIEGREIILNQEEISRVGDMTDRKGVIARYENRNDATTTSELQSIGQSYLKYKGSPEILLKVDTLNNIWNIGERVSFSAPLTELTTEYMVKKKTINYITTQDNIFYTYELSSNFNSETEINYFDNQRSKMMGNIGVGEYVSRNIDIENTANVIFYDLEVNEVELGDNTLQSELQTTLGVE